MKHEYIKFISQATIVIPIIILMFAGILKLDEMKTAPKANGKTLTATPTITPTKTPITVVKKFPQISLNGPVVCDYVSDHASMSAHIKDKNVSIHVIRGNITEQFTLSSDCFYRWTKGERKGEKTCGLGSIISMLEMFGISNMIDAKTVLSLATTYGVPEATNEAVINGFANSCRTATVDSARFTIPKNIIFSDALSTTPVLEKKP